MRRPNRTAFATLCIAALLAGASSAAAPASKSSAKKDPATLKREQAKENARAKQLKDKAAAAKRDEALLKQALANIETRAQAAREEALEAEAQAAALDARRLAETSDLARERRALDLTLVALLQSDAAARRAPLYRSDAQTALWISTAAPSIAQSAQARQRALDETLALRLALSTERDQIEARRVSLEAEQQQTGAKLADTARNRVALLAASDAASRRAAALGREAKTLAELASKVRAASPKPLTGVATGPRQTPVVGTIIQAYGASTAAGPAKGITVRTKAGAKIVAPGGGTVGYAGAFRSYGQVVIIDQADGSSLVLTGLHSVLATAGKKVSAGEVVGEMEAAAALPAPELYFEVRQAGRTVDPERWLKARS